MPGIYTRFSSSSRRSREEGLLWNSIRRKSVFVDIWTIGCWFIYHFGRIQDSTATTTLIATVDSFITATLCRPPTTTTIHRKARAAPRYTFYRHILGVRGRTMGSRVSNIIIVLSVDSGSTGLDWDTKYDRLTFLLLAQRITKSSGSKLFIVVGELIEPKQEEHQLKIGIFYNGVAFQR